MARTEEMMGFAYRSALSLPNRNVLVVSATPARVTYCLTMIKKKVIRDNSASVLNAEEIILTNGSTIRGLPVSTTGEVTIPDMNLIVWDEIELVEITKLDTVLSNLLPLLSEREGHLVTSMDHSAEFFHRIFNSVLIPGTAPYESPLTEAA